MTFHTKPFEERMKVMGDPAEKAFENWAYETFPYVRRGFNRPPFSKKAFMGIPKIIRLEPDYLAEINEKVYYIECKGFGRHPLKIKVDTFNQWYSLSLSGMETLVFVYDQTEEQVFTIPYRRMYDAASDKPVQRFENDHKEYVEFTREELATMHEEYL